MLLMAQASRTRSEAMTFLIAVITAPPAVAAGNSGQFRQQSGINRSSQLIQLG
jgi:hypothetical protein